LLGRLVLPGERLEVVLALLPAAGGGDLLRRRGGGEVGDSHRSDDLVLGVPEAGPDQLGAAAGAQRLLDLVAVDPVFAALLLAPDRPDVPAPLGGELRLPEQLLHGERGLVGLARGREAVLAGGAARQGARRLGGGARRRGRLVLRRRPRAGGGGAGARP